MISTFFSFGSIQYFISRYHYPKVNDIIAIAAQYNAYNIFTYIMHISFYSGQ